MGDTICIVVVQCQGFMAVTDRGRGLFTNYVLMRSWRIPPDWSYLVINTSVHVQMFTCTVNTSVHMQVFTVTSTLFTYDFIKSVLYSMAM